ncbi:MAG: oligosaccharide flippase family protein [Candidatus Woesebacteria bacterium]|nr:oligosaccharide flippase family protein [Candidatus Woesebacteria bacterium]
MKERIKQILRTKTFSQTVITSFGTVVNGILGLFFYILAARYLGPSKFGIFSISVSVIALIASIANFGVDTGIVRFVGRSITHDREKALKFLKAGFYIKVVSSLLVIILGWYLVPFAAIKFFQKSELIFPLRLSLIGVGSALLFSYVSSAVQALQRFWVWSGLNIFSNLLRLLATIGLFALGLFSVQSALSVYIIFPFLGFLVGLFFLPNFFKVKKERAVLSEFLKFNGWVAAFTIIAAIASRLDTFLSARFLTLGDVGIYSVAVSLTSFVPQIVFAIGTVVAPKLASFTSKTDVLKYLKKLQLFVIGIGVFGVVIGIPLSHLVIPFFYGGEYVLSIYPFIILLLAQTIFLISIPVHTSIIYYFSYPKFFVITGIVNLLIVFVGGWFLIGSFGYVGAAWAIFIGNIFNFVVPAIWVINKFRKK